ncbi:MAG: hypothetical protein H6774_02480 [Pseudomonadales bacterium]|nr:hypothetical protein [Pseudomonadales bacterium]
MLNKEQSMKEFLGAQGELHTAVTKFFALSEQEQQPKLTSIEEMPRPNLNLLTYVFPHILRLSADDYGTHSGVNFEELNLDKPAELSEDCSVIPNSLRQFNKQLSTLTRKEFILLFQVEIFRLKSADEQSMKIVYTVISS